ncbi:DUF134 domain-containing protein [Lachnospiraceae bacterium 62-35]
MARPQRSRRICEEPAYDSFSPNGISSGEPIVLTVDEYEAIRLVDLEKKTHEQCAALMDISRTTVTEIYESARYKIAKCLVDGRKLLISGGHYRLCDGMCGCCKKADCKQRYQDASGETTGKALEKKGADTMRVAVTYENGNVFQHFGHTGQFKVYDIEEQKIVKEQIIDTMENGHGALAGLLTDNNVDVLICGGIGGGAQNALADAGIRLYGGVTGNADEAVAAWLAGTLAYNPEVHCSHHEQGHHSHEHSCGEGGECHGHKNCIHE